MSLSKLARVVEAFALRPQVQERLTDQIADAIMEGLHPLCAICVIEASDPPGSKPSCFAQVRGT